MGMLATLVLGLYLGSLLPGLLNAPDGRAPVARQPDAAAQAAAQTQQPAASASSPAAVKDNQPPCRRSWPKKSRIWKRKSG